MPDHPTIHMAAKQDFLSFYQSEIESRKQFSYPPFSHLVKISFSGKNEEETQNIAEGFRKELLGKIPADYLFHPLVPSGHKKVQDCFHFFFIVRGKTPFPITKAIESIKTTFSIPSSIRLHIDVDPLSTFF